MDLSTSTVHPSIEPLGGKGSRGLSAVVDEENRVFFEYRAALAGVLAKHGAINTPEASHDLRGVIARFMPATKKDMSAMGYSF